MKRSLSVFLFFILLVNVVGIIPVEYVKAESPVLVERGRNYEIWDNGDGTYTWRSAPTWIWNGTQYVPYIFDKSHYQTDGYVSVQAGLIGAKFYKGKVEYYDPSLSDLRVGRESWLVYEWDDANSEWKPVCASLAKYFDSASFYEGEDYLNITASWVTNAGNLTIIYHFEEHLKHTVLWKPNYAGRYAICQVWNRTIYDDVKLSNATVIKRTHDAIIGKADALTVLFHNQIQPFGILEDQRRAQEYLHKILFAGGTLTYQGITITDAVAWIFYNSTLSVLDAGDTLRIDPATYTASPPTADAYVYDYYPDSNFGTETDVRVQTSYDEPFHYNQRSFLKFSLSGLPSGVTITQAKLKVYCYAAYGLISGVTDVQARRVTNDSWTETGITWNNQPAYGAVEDTKEPAEGEWIEWDVTSWVQNEWSGDKEVSICLKSVQEDYSSTNRYSRYYSKEYDSYDPQLIVTYNTAPAIGEFAAPSTVYADKYFLLNATINDADGVSDFKNASVELSNGIILLWDNATDTFSEYQDTNNYVTLNDSESIRTSINSTAYKLSWKIKLSSSHPEGSVDIVATNTKVFDSAGISGSNSQAGIFTFANPPSIIEIEKETGYIGNSWGYLNITVSDLTDDVDNVTVKVTLADASTFSFEWSRSTNSSTEKSDPSNQVEINSTSSYAIQLNSTTIKVLFYWKPLLSAYSGYCDLDVYAEDDDGNTDHEFYDSYLYIYVYSETPIDVFAEAINSIFSYFGVSNFITSAFDVINIYADYITDSISYMQDYIVPIFTLFANTVGWILDWFSKMVNIYVQVASTVKAILDGTATITTVWGDVWKYIELSKWEDAIPIFIFISWLVSIDERARKTGMGWMSVFMSDINNIISVLSFIYNMAFMVFNTVLDLVFKLLGAVPI